MRTSGFPIFEYYKICLNPLEFRSVMQKLKAHLVIAFIENHIHNVKRGLVEITPGYSGKDVSVENGFPRAFIIHS
jgi:hypothetical protein